MSFGFSLRLLLELCQLGALLLEGLLHLAKSKTTGPAFLFLKSKKKTPYKPYEPLFHKTEVFRGEKNPKTLRAPPGRLSETFEFLKLRGTQLNLGQKAPGFCYKRNGRVVGNGVEIISKKKEESELIIPTYQDPKNRCKLPFSDLFHSGLWAELYRQVGFVVLGSGKFLSTSSSRFKNDTLKNSLKTPWNNSTAQDHLLAVENETSSSPVILFIPFSYQLLDEGSALLGPRLP